MEKGKIIKKISSPLSKEEQVIKEYKEKNRNLEESLARAAVVRRQLSEAYEILENINFKHLGDTAFQEKIVRAKRSIASAMKDFLLDNQYWRGKIKEHNGRGYIEV